MINFEGYYNIAADQIKYIDQGCDSNNRDHPYCVRVYLISGDVLRVNFSLKTGANEARNRLVSQIERERRSDYEQLYSKLFLIEDAVKRIDKRGLRIWRQLHALLGEKVGEEP